MARLDRYRLYWPLRQRRWPVWLNIVVAALLACQVLAFFGASSALFSPLVYPQLAPAGWHNITPYGNIVLGGFAVSRSTPGLMVACATSFSIDVRDPSTWRPGEFRFWQSRDGGSSWDLLHPPIADGDQCTVTLPPDGSILISMSTYSLDTNRTATSITWVSHDAGRSWQRPAPDPTVVVDGQSATVSELLLRSGALYGIYNTNDAYGDDALAVSADNGRTWRAFSTMPSALAQQGWRDSNEVFAHMVVPDFRSDHAWYRVLYAKGRVPVLEHSLNDGSSWSAVGPVGSTDAGEALVAVNPAQPGHLCASFPHAETDHISLLSSSDGGKTWQAGTMPPAYQHTVGETSFSPPVMDAQGSCYDGYHFGRGGPLGEGGNTSQYVVFRQAADSAMLQALPISGSGEDADVLSEDIDYVPASNGKSGRLEIQAGVQYRSWAALFSGLAGETTSQQLFWTAVP